MIHTSEEYWVPCVWTSVLRSTPEIPWQLLGLTLLDPLSSGLYVYVYVYVYVLYMCMCIQSTI
jgi:hypothetical protein